MRLGFLELPAHERRLYIEQAATRRNVSPVLLEKDFWVCWLLGMLFESEFAGSLGVQGAAHPYRRYSASLTGSRKTSTCRWRQSFCSYRRRGRAETR